MALPERQGKTVEVRDSPTTARTDDVVSRPGQYGRLYVGGLPCFDSTCFDPERKKDRSRKEEVQR